MFTLNIQQGNAAMQTPEDLAGALRRAARELDAGERSGIIRDDNGNTVGLFSDDAQVLTQREFTPADHDESDKIAARLGYEQTAYTSTSALWGLFCMRDSAQDMKRDGCIIATQELGLLFVQTAEDILNV